MIHDEKLYPLPEAYELATGTRPHVSTCHRHRLRGIHGVRLETVRCGGKRLTSPEAVKRFNSAVTVAADGGVPSPQTVRQRQSAITQAERELDREGI